MVSHAPSYPRPNYPQARVQYGRALSSWAPVVDPLTLVDRIDGERHYIWNRSEQSAWIGVGCHRKITSEGPERFRQQAQQAGDILGPIEGFSLDGAPTPEPRMFGGFAFSQNTAPKGSPWSNFANTEFVLPKWSYQREGERAWITVYYDADENPEELRQNILAKLVQQIDEKRKPALGANNIQKSDEKAEDWAIRIEAIQRQIQSGDAKKIVAARECIVSSNQAFRIGEVLKTLRKQDTSSLVFAYPILDSIFAGATPETLLKKAGNKFETEALAGTVNASSLGAEDILKKSLKDHNEHNFVRTFILDRLEPLCQNIDFDPTPDLRRLRDVLHLRTAITGELSQPSHILEILESLHPTPAVAGIPSDFAQSTIEASEPFSRGWYAGPIGWFNKHGDGEFAVALRCGLITGQHAHVFSGAGIVSASNADAEFEETRLKQQLFLSALQQE